MPGSIGRMVELHGRYYARDWRLGHYFEAKVASELGELVARLDPKRDGFWIAAEDDEIVGGIAIDGSGTPRAARLRFFIVDDAHRGAGLGERLMCAALDFCRDAGHRHVFLTTFAGLDAARKLYERHGFVLAEERPHRTWGVEVTEQRFDLHMTHSRTAPC
ncbi:MAG TPA: GNAT family N-acetyltransferase [Burkholderiales bacterium]|nr:GNAT family N-acetyltransferase [Burkholderiales bacterium]